MYWKNSAQFSLTYSNNYFSGNMPAAMPDGLPNRELLWTKAEKSIWPGFGKKTTL